MKITVLGSGTGIPSLSRNAPGFLLDVGEKLFLVDCGSATLLQLERIKKSFWDLDGVFITHTHADHIGDLMPLVHAFRLPGHTRTKPFTLVGPPGFVDFFERIIEPVIAKPTKFPFYVQDVYSNLDQWPGLTITYHKTIHTEKMPSVAYGFEYDGKRVVFSGDCDYDPKFIDFSLKADMLILDCSTLDSNKVQGHLSTGLAGFTASKAQVKHLIPTHFYPIPRPDSHRIRECRIHFSGNLDLAEDLKTFEV